MHDDATRQRFERLALEHLDAAYNLARWLTRNDQDAQDVVQDAFIRAMRYFASFRGELFRPWWLTIVRHTCYGWLKLNRPAELVTHDDMDDGMLEGVALAGDGPEETAMRNADRARINHAISALPIDYREVLVLRELEDLSYKDIARIVDVPIGTVMSRLSRARGLLRESLQEGARPTLRAVPSRGGQR